MCKGSSTWRRGGKYKEERLDRDSGVFLFYASIPTQGYVFLWEGKCNRLRESGGGKAQISRPYLCVYTRRTLSLSLSISAGFIGGGHLPLSSSMFLRGFRCRGRGEPGHFAGECPGGDGGSGRSFGGRGCGRGAGGGSACYSCGKPGHFARECPQAE
ncbi:hypothetical protein KP509_22G075900 [Ceratopteris richardii]|uniref:CCHC-type domain-containing protein n=1 Tax=Ceratopteris richardii TaxID=49495 RepID=A0A8T2S8F3_CERRI|nr:hypothetical protein KP509_22G075900 [Ceratopteris richardii]